MSPAGQDKKTLPLSATDYHVLLVLAEEDLYGYGIMKAVEEDSRGTVSTEIGSLYRILARLMAEGFVDDIGTPKDAPTEHRGRARRYYRLTKEGRVALHGESRRLECVLNLARERSLLPEVAG